MKNFIQNNKVLIAALLSAIVLVLQQYLGQAEISWKAIGFAAFIAVLGVLANHWKGQGITITGIIGTLAGVFVTIQQTGVFTWNEFILAALVALLMSIASSLAPAPDPSKKPPTQ